MTSVSKNTIKAIKSLALKKRREELGLFVAEGEKIVNEAIDSDFEVVEIYRSSEIGEETMSRLTLLNTPSPVLAVIKIPQSSTEAEIQKLIEDRPLAIALDSVRDPGNLGTIIRLSDWFGIDAVFASEDTVDLYNPKVIQSTMGAIFRKRVIYCELTTVISRFNEAGMHVYGTFLEGQNIYRERLENEGLIILGSESNGISPQIAGKVTDKLFIPPFISDTTVTTSESLNVATAAAIICSEFRRRV